jgi:hypothetical protein
MGRRRCATPSGHLRWWRWIVLGILLLLAVPIIFIAEGGVARLRSP